MSARLRPAVAVLAAATLAGLAGLVGLAGCGGGTNSAGDDSGNPPGRSATSTKSHMPKVSGTITVFAAASLTESFTTLGKEFEAAHPGVTVRLSFGGSSALATQINQGAPADVFASAAPANMQAVTEQGHGAGSPTTFVRNQLVIAVPKGNPKHVRGLDDLTRPGTKVALCAEQVPCGAAARRALTAAHVKLTPVTLEPDVKGALTKVRIREVDAALVYRTDVRSAASDVDGVEFPESAKAVNAYPIVVLKDGRNPNGGRRFVDYVLSGRGRDVLTRAGFRTP
ncbi:molybdate ABC transporter substrate-binding protein [Actinopolymorpha singaporensis]|uniref:Molybdate transport system substrate-binding protein n=1 Tax=Actinopolymorpha singaporensis TaxID=117157 RepID=A0A1H1RV90_9ACTN|nr:molybdate ABC transporter substrate-binding protein [Actinopolymorpha singaporensis]SDS38909.1 molybdate transport system substrate-binding protein [Actinopolymorpha singaporensis]